MDVRAAAAVAVYSDLLRLEIVQARGEHRAPSFRAAAEDAVTAADSLLAELGLASSFAPTLVDVTSEPEWLTINEACLRMGVSRRTMHAWIKKGSVQTDVTPGGQPRVARHSLGPTLMRRSA